MAHGQPDFGAYSAKQTIGSMADNAELAARLGSLVTFDRKGDVLWTDDFEDNAAKWLAAYVGGAGTWALSAVRALMGGSSGVLTTAAAIGATAEVIRRVFYPVVSKVGFEIAFNFGAGAYPVEFKMTVDDRVNITEYLIRYNFNTSDLDLVTAGGAVISIDPNLVVHPAGTGFHLIKLTVDIATGHFEKVLIDDMSYDISAYGGQVIGLAVSAGVYLSALVTSTLAAGVNMFLDNAIFTQNEP